MYLVEGDSIKREEEFLTEKSSWKLVCDQYGQSYLMGDVPKNLVVRMNYDTHGSNILRRTAEKLYSNEIGSVTVLSVDHYKFLKNLYPEVLESPEESIYGWWFYDIQIEEVQGKKSIYQMRTEGGIPVHYAITKVVNSSSQNTYDRYSYDQYYNVVKWYETKKSNDLICVQAGNKYGSFVPIIKIEKPSKFVVKIDDEEGVTLLSEKDAEELFFKKAREVIKKKINLYEEALKEVKKSDPTRSAWERIERIERRRFLEREIHRLENSLWNDPEVVIK